MKSLQEFFERFAGWIQSNQLASMPLATDLSPILLYQSIFSFIHEMKSSLALSEAASLTELHHQVQAIDQLIQPLAFAYQQLSAQANHELKEALLTPKKDLAILISILDHSTKQLVIVPNLVQSLEAFTNLDSLSKARLISTTCYHYQFFSKQVEMPLDELPQAEKNLKNWLHKLNGILVTQKLSPKANLLKNNIPTVNPTSSLILHIQYLCAFPPKVALAENSWTALQ